MGSHWSVWRVGVKGSNFNTLIRILAVLLGWTVEFLKTPVSALKEEINTKEKIMLVLQNVYT